MLVESAACSWGDLAADWAGQARLQAGCKRRKAAAASAGCAAKAELHRAARQERPGQLRPLRAVKTARQCEPPEPEPHSPTTPSTDRQRFLLRYAQEVTPEIISLFEEEEPAYVADAMRETIGRMLGSLPEEFFDVTVSAARSEDLAQLCYSVIMTGYLFRAVESRLALQAQLDDFAERDALAVEVLSACRSESGYAEGSQKDQVAGHVLRWRHDSGLQAIPAQDYISSLERQVATLRRQIAKDLILQARSNPLLSYLQALEASQLTALTSTAQTDTLEAVNSVVHSVMQASDMQQGAPQRVVRAGELASLLYWLCIVGYHLRTLEARWDLEQSLLLSS